MPFCDMFFIELHITKVGQMEEVHLRLEAQVSISETPKYFLVIQIAVSLLPVMACKKIVVGLL